MAEPTRITLATPMITPSRVRKLRSLCDADRIESQGRRVYELMPEAGPLRRSAGHLPPG